MACCAGARSGNVIVYERVAGNPDVMEVAKEADAKFRSALTRLEQEAGMP